MNKSENNENIVVLLSKDQCEALIDFIESDLLDYIRKDEYIDNLNWLRCILSAIDTMKYAIEESEFVSVPDLNYMQAAPFPHAATGTSCGDSVITLSSSADDSSL